MRSTPETLQHAKRFPFTSVAEEQKLKDKNMFTPMTITTNFKQTIVSVIVPYGLAKNCLTGRHAVLFR